MTSGILVIEFLALRRLHEHIEIVERWGGVNCLKRTVDLRERNPEDPRRVLDDTLVSEERECSNRRHVTVLTTQIFLDLTTTLVRKVQVNVGVVVTLRVDESEE
jgi:hypothetical protein